MKALYLEEYQAFIRYHEIVGNLPPRIYLPGLSTASVANLMSTATHPRLVGNHSLLIDYLGSGLSDHPDIEHTMEQHAEIIAKVLDHEQLKKVTLIGHSMGGTVGILLAEMRPDLVARLIVSEGNVTSGGGAGTKYIAGFNESEFVESTYPKMIQDLRDKGKAGDEVSAFVAGTWGICDPLGLHRSSVALVNVPDDLINRMGALEIPTSFVYGEKNFPPNGAPITPDTPDPEQLEALNIEIGVVSDAGHMMQLDNLEGWVDVVEALLTD